MFDENGTLLVPDGVDLWCRRGIPRPEIVRLIGERSDTDCAFAFNVLKASPVGSLLLNLFIEEQAKYPDAQAMIENDTERIKQVIASFRHKFGVENPAAHFFEEVHALAIEYLFREKKKFLAANS